MASTKEMQLRAKARKQGAKVAINQATFSLLLTKIADALISQVPDHDYDQTEESLSAAVQVANHYKLGSHLYQLVEIREKFEQGLTTRYGVKFPEGIGAFCVDIGAIMQKANVPQKQRVISGFFDTLIGVVSVKNGSVKFQ